MILRRSLRQFITLVAFPLFLAGGGTVWLTADLVGRISTGANQEDRARTAEIVESALAASCQQLANLVADNANWDDAALQVYTAHIDEDFVKTTWGDTSGLGVNYDGVLLVDAAGRQLASYVKGESVVLDPEVFFSGRLTPVLAALPHNNREAATAANLLATTHGPALVAAGNIVPTTATIDLGTAEPRFLVFWKYLSPEFIAGLGDKFVVNGLNLVPAEQARDGDVAVASSFGDRLGVLQWLDRRPGDLALRSVQPKAYVMLLVLIGVMSAIALLSWRQFRIIAHRERQAQHDATHDTLTGLPNRSALMTTLGTLLKDSSTPVCATFIDLDGFKEVNDTYDHETGDRLIRAVAAGLTVLAYGSRLVSRIGGDEFVVVHAGPEAEQVARAMASQIIAFLDRPIDIDGRLARVGASLGVACTGTAVMTASELMRRADVAMYAAKDAGKNCTCVYAAAMDAARDEAAVIARELGNILDAGRLDVAYQPIIDAQTLQMTGVEALARWPASSAQPVGPDRFIPIAETSGLIDRLGNYVLERACLDALGWGDLRVSVNVSPVQLRNPDFAIQAVAVIDRTGIQRSRVELEVTEGTMIDSIQHLQPIFRQLREAGISIALDDFGSGYSSIAYLRELEFDRIKIDRSLTRAMISNEAARTMIQATGLIAQGISAAVTAEGVESGDEINLLRLAGCSELQGYHFGKPQAAAAIAAALIAMAERRAAA